MKLSEAAVSNIENDITNITVTQLEDISNALNVSIEQLLCDPQEKFNLATIQGKGLTGNEQANILENELVKALIASLEKKDQQLHAIMQQCIHAMHTLMQPETQTFNASNHAASRV